MGKSVSGNLTVRVMVNAEGLPAIQSIEGPLLLAQNVAEEISALKFATGCAGQEVDLRIAYRLIAWPYEVGEESSATAANEWLVKSPYPCACDLSRVGSRKKPWWKRLFRRW
jgi:hypothetical protein